MKGSIFALPVEANHYSRDCGGGNVLELYSRLLALLVLDSAVPIIAIAVAVVGAALVAGLPFPAVGAFGTIAKQGLL